jgi:hypothetical protein
MAVLIWLAANVSVADDIDFNRDIRPILSNHCFQCHGMDAGARQADLRLDKVDDAIASGHIVPGSPGDSELVNRITATDDLLRMPPPDANKPLSPEQIDLLTRWIEQGAEHAEHWAFRPIVARGVPLEYSDQWCRNEIDVFIHHRLQQEGLTPSEEADRPTLIRRLYQDLLGLLPTPEEVDAFVNDQSPTAYDDLVTRLLASPHYGERWGRHWLDQARYADSSGYTIDGERIAWPYRDWVIWAVNEDMPFDQFTIEQLAGDLLPEPTLNQRIATGFHRNTMINQEGGVKPDQFRNEALVDRVNTTGAVWLGLTVGCAQCHTHKFDPISHEEYYRLYAFFNNATDANSVGATVNVHEGEVFGWTPELYALQTELDTLRAEEVVLKEQLALSKLAGVAWEWRPAEYVGFTAASGAMLTVLEDGSFLLTGSPTENESYELHLKEILPEFTAVRVRVLPHESLPNNGPGTASNGNFVLSEAALKVDNQPLRFAEAWADHSQPDYPVRDALDDKPTTGWAINVGSDQAAAGVMMNAPHEAIFTLAEPLATADKIIKLILKHDTNKNYLIGRFAIDVTATPVPEQSEQDERAAQLAVMQSRIAELEAQLPGSGSAVTQMIMEDAAETTPTYILTRGDFLTPDIEHGALTPGVPEVLIPEGVETPQLANRLDLATWLVSPDNPLTSRVTVNRVWMRYFGKGLVETENDFGYQGMPPTHPELLDWLAAEFMSRGWSMKELHRLIVTSATYRQSSEYRPELAERDANNRLLGRQARLRVESEIVRDLALVASGLFSPEIGGPSVYPPQPEGIYAFTQNPHAWPTSTGPDRYRRTMYAAFYRSAPHPLMQTFDAPDFSTVCTRRVRSNTPLQSLALANDPLFKELAEGLAVRVVAIGIDSLSDDAARMKFMFRTCLSRQPTEAELTLLTDYLNRERTRFSADVESARAFVSLTENDAAIIELAAWTSAARVLMNTDEFVTRN